MDAVTWACLADRDSRRRRISARVRKGSVSHSTWAAGRADPPAVLRSLPIFAIPASLTAAFLRTCDRIGKLLPEMVAVYRRLRMLGLATRPRLGSTGNAKVACSDFCYERCWPYPAHLYLTDAGGAWQ
jgi:hypothetical protein